MLGCNLYFYMYQKCSHVKLAHSLLVIWKMTNPSTLQCRICLKYVVNVKSHLWIKFDMYMYQQPILIYQKDRTLQRANSGFKLLNNIKVHFEIFRWLSSWALISLISVTPETSLLHLCSPRCTISMCSACQSCTQQTITRPSPGVNLAPYTSTASKSHAWISQI